jgi:ComEC/Rec2-related protein
VLVSVFGINKQTLFEKIDGVLGRNEAMLVKGMVWGESIDDGMWKKKMINSGLVHLVVVSGGNLMIIMMGAVGCLAGFVNRKVAIIAALVLGWWYVFFTGWQISSLRAVLLVSLVLVAQLYGRKFNLLRGIILILTMMLIIDKAMIYEISFWLSFGAFFGSISANVWWKNIWVSLWVMPILWWCFGTVNLALLVSGFLIWGVVEWIMVLGIGALLLGNFAYWMMVPVLKYFLKIIDVLGSQHWLNVSVKMNSFILIGWYLLLIGLASKMQNEI